MAKIPKSLGEYLDPTISTLNPYNIGNRFFVYGTFPLTLNKILATILNLDNYNDFTLLGRRLSAIFDLFSLILVYKIVSLWERKYKLDKKLKFLAAFFYAIAVYPIQASHFFTVDTFLTFFMVGSFYFALKFFYQSKPVNLALSSILFGLALGAKVNAVFILPLLLFLILFPSLKEKNWSVFTLIFFIFVVLSYLFLRIADPKFFADGNIFNAKANPIFVQNLKELRAFSSPGAWYPPAIQWINETPIIYPLQNIAFFGLGLPHFVLCVLGIFYFLRLKKIEFFAVFVWVLGFFLYQSSQFVQTFRYFIFLYPFFAIFASFGTNFLINRPNLYWQKNKKSYQVPRSTLHVLLFILVLIWPLSFIQIYTKPHSRVEASYWINKNIPEGVVLGEEHWDDPLPLGLSDIKNRQYTIEQMPVFAPDDDEKWSQINNILAQADYIIFTSNRGYGSITTVPEKYPKMAKFYEDLFAGKLNFRKIKEITSYPTLNLGFLKIEFPDDRAEEAFTVYDHPKVTIFKKL